MIHAFSLVCRTYFLNVLISHTCSLCFLCFVSTFAHILVSNIVLVTVLISCAIHLYLHLIIIYYCAQTVTAYLL